MIPNLVAMGSIGRLKKSIGVLFCGALPFVIAPVARAADGEVVAVSSRASDDYIRTRLADGSFEPETYTFGEGGIWRGAPDRSIDKLKFIDVARTIAVPLVARHYVPATDLNQTKLLIMVYWGLTTAPTPVCQSSTIAQMDAAQTNLQIARTPIREGKVIFGELKTISVEPGKKEVDARQ